MGDGIRHTSGNVRWAYEEFLKALQANGVGTDSFNDESFWTLDVEGYDNDTVVRGPSEIFMRGEKMKVRDRSFNLGRNLYGAYNALRLATYALEEVRVNRESDSAEGPTTFTRVRIPPRS